MAEDLIDQCSKLQIVNAEYDIVDLGDGFDEDIDDKLAMQLLGCIVTEKPLNFEAVKHTLFVRLESQRWSGH